MRSAAAVLSLLAAFGLAACGSDREGLDARARLYESDADDPVQQALREPARMTVVYWPALGECMPTERVLLDEFEKIRGQFPDVRFVTVVPESSESEIRRYGRPLPGEMVVLEPQRFLAHDRLGPRPRIEVWSANGELFLLQSIPPFVPRAKAAAQEIIWARAFTEPLPAAQSR